MYVFLGSTTSTSTGSTTWYCTVLTSMCYRIDMLALPIPGTEFYSIYFTIFSKKSINTGKTRSFLLPHHVVSDVPDNTPAHSTALHLNTGRF